jgi:hypothetical protein
MLSKVESNEINNKKQKNKNKLKKFNKNNLGKLLESNDTEDNHEINSDNNVQSDDQDFDSILDEKLPKDQIDYTMKKPGPHAKAGEWRKWKMMRIHIYFF